MNIKKSVLETIGKTPLIEIDRFKEATNIKNNLYTKVEFFNPGGSVKDRVGLNLIKQAYQDKLIDENTTIIEPTSGNTGIGLAIACAIYGNKLILTMPETMSIERQKLLKAYGANLVLTEGKKGMQGAVDKDDFNDKIDYFVAGIGTGGTITGVSKVLKEKYPEIKIIAVEPSDSPLISKGKAGSHGIQGIGANFIPEILDLNIIDEVITIDLDEAYQMSRLLAKKEGLLVGISSGAALAAASKLPGENKNIVVLLPDTGERYLSTALFE